MLAHEAGCFQGTLLCQSCTSWLLFSFFFLTVLHIIHDLSSLTRDRTHIPCSGSMGSLNAEPPGKAPPGRQVPWDGQQGSQAPFRVGQRIPHIFPEVLSPLFPSQLLSCASFSFLITSLSAWETSWRKKKSRTRNYLWDSRFLSLVGNPE